MTILPKIEKVTRDATATHFFLMFGYKVFSLYFPLFLVARGLSLPQVGYTYLLIYLPLALFAPVAGFLNHRLNPAVLASLGILGYGVYALGMITIQAPFLFYFWQVLLGISAALFFASSRGILMGSALESPARSFGWFYSAPFYADALAPAVGAFFIWQFGFIGVFVLSLIIHFFNAFFCFFRLRGPARILPDHGFSLKHLWFNYGASFQKLIPSRISFLILISLSLLFVGGFYRAFFVLFLKQGLGWTQNLVLIFGAVFSLSFLPFSLWIIKLLEKKKVEKNVLRGGLIAGVFSILLGGLAPFLNFFSVLLINIGRTIGNLLSNSGRSGLINRQLRDYPEEAGAIDTIFAPFASAVGSLAGGLIIGFLGFNLLFVAGGIFIILVCQIAKFKLRY